MGLVPLVFCGGWTEMDQMYNTTDPKMRTVTEPVILHFTGGPKPWRGAVAVEDEAAPGDIDILQDCDELRVVGVRA